MELKMFLSYEEIFSTILFELCSFFTIVHSATEHNIYVCLKTSDTVQYSYILYKYITPKKNKSLNRSKMIFETLNVKKIC